MILRVGSSSLLVFDCILFESLSFKLWSYPLVSLVLDSFIRFSLWVLWLSNLNFQVLKLSLVIIIQSLTSVDAINQVKLLTNQPQCLVPQVPSYEFQTQFTALDLILIKF